MADIFATARSALVGYPPDPAKRPDPAMLLEAFALLDTIVNAFTSNGGLIYDTLAHLNADLAHGADTSAWVVSDATAANNGIYQKAGASDSGSWSRVIDLPYSFITASNAGAGTANAIVATTDLPIPSADGAALISLPIYATNTASPVTVAFNGGSTLTVKSASGAAMEIGNLKSGTRVWGTVSGSTFQLTNDFGSPFLTATGVAGTANAITATIAAGIPSTDGGALIALPIANTNTGTPVTVAFNGGTALTIKSNSGSDMTTGGLVAGMIVAGYISGSTFRLLSDQASSAILSAVEDARDQAVAAAATAAGGVVPAATRTVLAGVDASTREVAYLTEAGYDGSFAAVDNTDGTYDDLITADTVGGEIKVTTANANLAYLRGRKNGDYIKLSEEGGDLTVANAVAAQRLALFGPGSMVYVENNLVGSTPLTKGGIVPPGVSLVGLGEGKSIFTCDDMADGDFVDIFGGTIASGGTTVIDVRPLPGTAWDDHLTLLGSFQTTAVGDPFVVLDAASGLLPGDTLTLADETDGSWLDVRDYYRNVADFRVEGVSSDGTIVYVDHRIRDVFTYNSSTCKAWKKASGKGKIGGFSIDLSGNSVAGTVGVHLFALSGGAIVDSIDVRGAGENGVQLNQCIDVVATNCRSTTKAGATTVDVYALGIYNSTNSWFARSKGTSDWSGLATGGYDAKGAATNYNAGFDDCDGMGTGKSTSGSYGGNMHGNADLSGFRNSRLTSVCWSGRDAIQHGGEVTTVNGANADAKLGQIGEPHSGIYSIIGTKFSSLSNGGSGDPGGAILLQNRVGQVGEVFVNMEAIAIDMPSDVQPIKIVGVGSVTTPISLKLSGRANIGTAINLVALHNGNYAIKGSYLDLKGVVGLPSGVGYASSSADGTGGHMDFAEWGFPVQSGTWTTSGGSSLVQETSAAITLPHSLPAGGKFVPRAWCQPQSSGLGNEAKGQMFAVTNSSVRPQVATGGGASMTAAATPVGWWVN